MADLTLSDEKCSVYGCNEEPYASVSIDLLKGQEPILVRFDTEEKSFTNINGLFCGAHLARITAIIFGGVN